MNKAWTRARLDEIQLRARAPAFYARLGISDTTEGRFDLLCLHLWLVLDRLEALGEKDAAQDIVDMTFTDVEAILRERGAGDATAIKGVKRLSAGFSARMTAFADTRDETAAPAVMMQVFFANTASACGQAFAMAAYAQSAAVALRSWLPSMPLDFGPIPD